MSFSPTFGRIFSPSFKPNSLAVPVVADGWWNLDGILNSCVGAWQPKGAKNSGASLLDISGNGNNASVLLDITWDVDDGWTGGALSTGIAADQTTSIIVRYANRSRSIAASVFGTNDNSPSRFKHLLYSETEIYTYFGNKSKVKAITSGIGVTCVVAICGQSTAGYKDYINGNLTNTSADAVFTATGSNILLRCSTTGNVPPHKFLAATIHQGTTLLDAQVASISAAMAAL